MPSDDPEVTITDEARFRAFVTASSDVVYRMSPDWSEVRQLVGRKFLKDTGAPDASWVDGYIPAEAQAHVRAAIDQAIRMRSVFELEHQVIRADGSLGWTLSRAVPLLNEAGEIEEWVGTARDLTAVKEAAEAQAAAEKRLWESEALRRVAIEGGRMGTWRWDLTERLVSGDAQFLALWGFEPSYEPLPLSLFTDRMSPQGSAEMESIVTRAIKAGEEFDGSLEIVSGPTAGHWVRWRGRVAVDDASRLYGVSFDITEQKETDARLRESEERFRAVVTASSDAVYRMSPDWAQMRQLEGKDFLPDTTEPSETWLDRYIHPDDQPPVQAAIHRAIRTKSMFQLEHRVLRADDSLAWTFSRAVPMLTDQGEITEWLGAATDVTAAKEAAIARAAAEEALRESEARFRMVADNISQLAWTCDNLGNVNWYNKRWLDYTGLSFEDTKSWGWDKVQHPEHVERVVAGVKRAAASGEPWEDTFSLRRQDGEYRWFYSQAMPIRNEDGQIVQWFGTNTDITDLRRAEDRQRVLLHELQHRVRNTLAVVRSIASRTGETSETVDDFASHLEGRLNALARTQMVLTRALGEGVDLETMVREELLAQAAQEAQIEIEGEGVRLSPKAAEVLALAVHELATNAVKYGALAAPAGRVKVKWDVEPRDGASWVNLTWEESGVRVMASAPRRKGFGTELIETRVPYELRGRGALQFRPGGLRCEIAFPLRAQGSILQTSAPAIEGPDEA